MVEIDEDSFYLDCNTFIDGYNLPTLGGTQEVAAYKFFYIVSHIWLWYIESSSILPL